MKRSDALKLIANQLDFLNNNFNGFRDNFSEDELKNSDVILTTLEHAGMLPPAYLKEYNPIPSKVAHVEIHEWEPE